MVLGVERKVKRSGEIPIEERAKHSEDCEICGSEATFRCPKCGNPLCDECKENPCEWEHYAEPQDTKKEFEKNQIEDEDNED
jgi:hypothetical protein